jgi:hypothetical protein
VPQRRFRSDDVLAVLADLFVEHGSPEHIRSDNVLTDQSRGSDQTAGLVAPALAGRC